MKLCGGRAYNNGVTFYSDNFSVRVIVKKGHFTIKIYSLKEEKYKILKILKNTPFIRGVIAFFKPMLELISKKYLILFTIFLVIISYFLTRFNIGNSIILNTNLFLPLILLLFFIFKFLPISKYHGAEHKVANSFYKGYTLNLEKIKKEKRISKSCGTNLVVNFLIFTIILPKMYGLELLLSYSIAYELHFIKNKYISFIKKPLLQLGAFLQWLLLTSEPEEVHILAAIEALNTLQITELEAELEKLNKENKELTNFLKEFSDYSSN